MALDWSSVFGLKVHSEPSCCAHLHSEGVQAAKNLKVLDQRCTRLLYLQGSNRWEMV